MSDTDDERAMNWLRAHHPDALEVEHRPFYLSRLVPCTIRCWRVGGPVTLSNDGVCPECGATWHTTLWEHLEVEP